MEVIWWTFFFSFWGVLGKRTLNPELLKCHEDRIKLETYTCIQQGKTMDNKFYIYVKTLKSLAKWWPGGGGASIFRLGPSWFTYTLHLHKIQGYQGHQNVSKRRPHPSGDIFTTRGNNLKTIFSFMGQNVKKMYILGVFWGPWGGLQWSD